MGRVGRFTAKWEEHSSKHPKNPVPREFECTVHAHGLRVFLPFNFYPLRPYGSVEWLSRAVAKFGMDSTLRDRRLPTKEP